MKLNFRNLSLALLGLTLAVVLVIILTSCAPASTQTVKLFSVKIDGATKALTGSALAETLLKLGEGTLGYVNGQIEIDVRPGYDLTVAKVDGCFLYFFAKVQTAMPFPINISGGFCLEDGVSLINDLRNGRLPLPLQILFGEDPGPVVMQYNGEDGWLKTESFNFIRLIQVMDRYQKSTDAQLIAIYNNQVTFLLVKVNEVCLWRLQVLDVNGNNVAQGNILACDDWGKIYEYQNRGAQ